MLSFSLELLVVFFQLFVHATIYPRISERANDTLFSRAFHTTSRYDFRANDIRPNEDLDGIITKMTAVGIFAIQLKVFDLESNTVLLIFGDFFFLIFKTR